jgi:hypothetical protein
MVEVPHYRKMFPAAFQAGPNVLDHAGSYEARLWRQAAQTIWTLKK